MVGIKRRGFRRPLRTGPNSPSAPVTRGNWTDGRISCRHSAPSFFFSLDLDVCVHFAKASTWSILEEIFEVRVGSLSSTQQCLKYISSAVGQPYYLADLMDIYELSRRLRSTIVTFLLFPPVLSHLLPLELFVYLRLIIGILSLRTSAHLTVLPLFIFSPTLNLTFSLLSVTQTPAPQIRPSTFGLCKYLIDIDIVRLTVK